MHSLFPLCHRCFLRREHACRPSKGEGSACSKCVKYSLFHSNLRSFQTSVPFKPLFSFQISVPFLRSFLTFGLSNLCSFQTSVPFKVPFISCEAPRTRYLTIPWIPRNLRRRYERCSRKQQNSNTVSPGSQVPH